jgi:hypothetical protein
MTIGELISELSKYDPAKSVMFQFKDCDELPIDHVVHNVFEGVTQNANDEMKPCIEADQALEEKVGKINPSAVKINIIQPSEDEDNNSQND